MPNPLLIAAIAAGVQHLLGGVAKKKQATAQQSLEETQYNDQVKTYLEEQMKEEDLRQQRVRLVTAFAKANGLDSALTPDVLAMISKRREPVAPPPYRKAGTPGFGWDMAANLVGDAGAIYGAAKAPKTGLQFLDPKRIASGASFGIGGGIGGTNDFFKRAAFTSPVTFGSGG